MTLAQPPVNSMKNRERTESNSNSKLFFHFHLQLVSTFLDISPVTMATFPFNPKPLDVAMMGIYVPVKCYLKTNERLIVNQLIRL